jgi:toxin ParE1/3/4
MKPFILHPDAETEFENSATYYEGQRAGLGEEFRAEVEDAIRHARATPTAFSPYKGGPARRVMVRRFPFAVCYVERDQAIYVVAIPDLRRRPDYWLDRLNDI